MAKLFQKIKKSVPASVLVGVVTPGTGPVPVPWVIGFFGPAGSLTATMLIIYIINILLAVVGLVAVLYVIIGGFRYVTAHGNEEQAEAAKLTITHAIIGIVIVILSFVIVRVIANALTLGVV
jgi:hypothetical protein